MHRCRLPIRALVALGLAAGLLAVAAFPARGQDRAKEISDLEKQIQQLTQRLNALRNEKPAIPGTLPAE
ncbi:MAG TPA: hypothetical protein VKE94_10475, partial [Gemmataceae bacterium]|nr:hypothetical protein [Gemmataceae bacterium]